MMDNIFMSKNVKAVINPKRREMAVVEAKKIELGGAQGLCSSSFKSCDRGGWSYKHYPDRLDYWT